jgi:hypothetical protein
MAIALAAKAVGTITSSPYTRILSRVSASGALAVRIAQIVSAMIGKHNADPMGANFLSVNFSPLGNTVETLLAASVNFVRSSGNRR